MNKFLPVFILCAASLPAWAAPISVTALNTPYTQNFDILAATGTPAGWAFEDSDGLYAAGTGSSATGNTYSFGASGSSERAFGSLASSSNAPTIGAHFSNDTGMIINALAISFFGEKWRDAAATSDLLAFDYSLDATSLSTGSWIAFGQLDFLGSSVEDGHVGSGSDYGTGNTAAYRKEVSATISDVLIQDGQSFWIRWSDSNSDGSDDGLAIDDFSLTPRGAAQGVPVGGSTVWMLWLGVVAIAIARRARLAAP